MNRRAFVTGLGAVFAAPLGAEAQPPPSRERRPGGKLPRVGYLSSGRPSDRSDPRFSYLFDAFVDGLRDAGYVDGQTVTIESRWAEQRYERLPDLAADLVRLGVAAIFAPTDHAATAARQVTQTIPIVFNQVADPVASRFADSVSRPGRNMTGFTLPGPEVTGKRLGFLKEAVPKLSRVAVLLNPNGTINVHHLPAAQKSARELGLHAQVFESRGPQDFDRVFTAIAADRVQGILLLPDTTFFIGREQLSKLALQHRLALSAHLVEYARSGMLLTYGPVLAAEWRRAGTLIGKILNGAKPADIPIEAPSKFELVINLKTAKALGLTIPQSLLLRADQVIE
jgi:putative tryptophan/tyrosine transport system substrate-binding protein